MLQVVAVDRLPATVLVVRDPDSAQLNRMLSRNNPGTGVHLAPDDRVGLVWPLSHDVQIGDQQAQLLESTPYFADKEAGLFWVLTRVSRPKKSPPPYRYADAVAVAAIEAYRSGAPRAVVLVSRPFDASQFTVEQVRGYLSTLGVPLHVWSYGPTMSPWGEAKPLNSFVAYQHAVTALKKDLDSQRIVWVAGEWRPEQISLSPETPDVTLVR